LAHSNAGVVANVHTVETFARDRAAALEANISKSAQIGDVVAYFGVGVRIIL
jgi:hypothetical protein